MSEQELKKDLELYRGMYYTLFNAISDVIEITSNNFVKNTLLRAVSRTRNMLIYSEIPSLTKKEAIDLLMRFINAMTEGVIAMDTDFIDMCVNKIFELEDIEPPSKEFINEGITSLSKNLKRLRKTRNKKQRLQTLPKRNACSLFAYHLLCTFSWKPTRFSISSLVPSSSTTVPLSLPKSLSATCETKGNLMSVRSL